MPEPVNSCLLGSKKELEEREDRADGFSASFSSTDNLLRCLLVDLGLTDTAKVLEEEWVRRLRSFSSSPTEVAGVYNHTADVEVKHLATDGCDNKIRSKTADVLLSHNDNNNKSSNKSENNGELFPQRLKEGGGFEGNVDTPPMDAARMALFYALVHSTDDGRRTGEIENMGVLHELCDIAIYALRWNTSQFSTSTKVTDSDGCKTTSLTPFLKKLFKVLLLGANNIHVTENKKSKGKEKIENDDPLFSTLPVEWLRIMEVFFAYVEVLWAQVLLVEAVSFADFTVQGWFNHKQRVLEQVSLLQERVHRLLLEAHQLVCFFGDGKQLTSPQNNEKNGSSLPFGGEGDVTVLTECNSASESEILTDKMYKGIAALFCSSDPTFRENIEEVSTWIMTQCSQHMQNEGATDFLQARSNEPILTDEGIDSVFPEETNNNGQSSLARNSWNMIIDVVRHALLGGAVGMPNKKSENVIPQSQINFNILIAQVIFRIQLFSWAIGSVAEFVEILWNHTYSPVEEKKRKGAKGGGRCKKMCKTPLPRPSIVNAALGFWYQHCAAEISNRINIFNATPDDNLAQNISYRSLKKEEKGQSGPFACSQFTQLEEDELRLGNSFVSRLKREAYAFLAGTVKMREPFHLAIVEGKLPRIKTTVMSFSASADGTGDTPPLRGADNKIGDFRTALLDILATGKQCQLTHVCESRHITLLRLLKKAFCVSRILLDLQDKFISVDMQLKAMENTSVSRLLKNKKRVNFAMETDISNKKFMERGFSCKIANNEPFLTQFCEEDVSTCAEVTPSSGGQQQRLSGSSALDRYLTSNIEETAEINEPPESSSFLRPQLQGQRPSTDNNEQTDETVHTASDDNDAISSTDYNLDRSGDVLLCEVQIVTVTPCGSLMAFLTTTGRLVVFALRVAKNLCPDLVDKRPHESFCERLILDVNILKESDGVPHWYEHLESLLVFSPSGDFLLCSVQNAPPFVHEGEEANRSYPSTMGKIFIYSLHCTENENCGVDCDDSNRLYAAFKIHTSLITVVRWVDPRFWRANHLPSGIRSLEKGAPIWKQEAYRRLSALQCLSTGRDNLIIRWLPADGSIIQKIVTIPVFDILVSPLMQAFYTINQNGQLSMYDAWNERDIENATDNTVIVSQRGLPVSLSLTGGSTEAKEEPSRNKSTAPLKDGEKQKDFFVGARIICFERHFVGQGGSQSESIITRMSRVVQKKGLRAGTETNEGNRLGRCILRHALHKDMDYFTSQRQSFVELSSDSGDETDENNNKNNNRTNVGDYMCSTSIYDYKETAAGANPFLMLRKLHSEDNGRKNLTSSFDATRRNVVFHSGKCIFYKTGSRLVFEEVSRLLCQTAGICVSEHDNQYAPPPQPYHLLSMAVSGSPVWNGEDEDDSFACSDSCISFQERLSGGEFVPLCSYYTDVQRRHGGQNAGGSFSKDNMTLLKINAVQKKNSGAYNCGRLKKKTVLSPVSRNGRYLCIMASVGPTRAAVPHNRPLEYCPGIYACVVFDVLYGTVVRVIPVCPVLPRESLTENAISLLHSKSRRAPIYMLPCSMTVVNYSHRRKSAWGNYDMCEKAAVLNHMMNSSGLESTEKKRNEGVEKLRSSDGSSYGSDDDDEDDDGDAMVLLAVGGLHSTAYIFDALTGCRIKVLNLRKQKNSQAFSKKTETRPASKRARCSYIMLSEVCSTNSHPSDEEENENEDKYNDDDVTSYLDRENSSILSESPLACGKEDRGNQRQELLCQLAGIFGIDTILGALTELLSVVPFPFFLYSDTPHEDGLRESCNRVSGVVRLEQPRDNFCSTAASATSCPLHLQQCPSFLGQLQAAAWEACFQGESATCAGRSFRDASLADVFVCGNVPFAFVARASSGTAKNANTSGGAAEAVRAVAAKRVRKRLRCGVVNSVALLYDRDGGGVYVFSSDEYGGLFLTGELITPRM